LTRLLFFPEKTGENTNGAVSIEKNRPPGGFFEIFGAKCDKLLVRRHENMVKCSLPAVNTGPVLY
jgi:hypothetical protein